MNFSIKGKVFKYINNLKLKRFIKNKKFWFIDIPRTSSSSIRLSLYKTLGKHYGKSNIFEKGSAVQSYYIDHLTTTECMLFFGQQYWEDINKFTVVRNSWSRFYSIFGYLQKAKKIPINMTFSCFLQETYNIFCNKNSNLNVFPKILIPQVSFLKKPNGTIDKTINVLKFENRDEELTRYFKKFDIKFISSEKLMSSDFNENYKNVYKDFEVALVAKMYAEDIARFNYKF